MAQRRMFSPDIVSSDQFLDMGQGAQVLYFHLAMRADDDGFVSPRSVMRLLGVADDELKVLLAKRFILPFDSGVIVIKHWLIHNLIRADLYKETQYKKEKAMLGLNENGAYTELRDGVAELKRVEAPKWLKQRIKSTYRKRTANVPQTALRLGKDRLGKVRIGKDKDSAYGAEVGELIKAFEEINPAAKKFYANTTQRDACVELIKEHGFERILGVIKDTLPKTNQLPYLPTITTPLQLHEKWASLSSGITKAKSKQDSIKKVVVI